jgi:hypothetical protein
VAGGCTTRARTSSNTGAGCPAYGRKASSSGVGRYYRWFSRDLDLKVQKIQHVSRVGRGIWKLATPKMEDGLSRSVRRSSSTDTRRDAKCR